MKESAVQRQIRLKLGGKPDLLVMRNNVGAWEDRQGNWTSYGLMKGSSDLVCVYKPSGRWFCVEIKAPGARTDKKRAESQALFRDLIREFGGFACQVDSVEAAEAAYERLCRGEDE